MRLTLPVFTLSAMIGYFGAHERLDGHRRFRPPSGVRPSSAPRQWWRYATSAVLSHVSRLRDPYTWQGVRSHARLRRSFVHLHSKLLRRGPASLSEADRVSLRQVRKGPVVVVVVWARRPQRPRGTGVRGTKRRATTPLRAARRGAGVCHVEIFVHVRRTPVPRGAQIRGAPGAPPLPLLRRQSSSFHEDRQARRHNKTGRRHRHRRRHHLPYTAGDAHHLPYTVKDAYPLPHTAGDA